MELTFIIMQVTEFGYQHVASTGSFSSKYAAQNYIKYNAHVLTDESRNPVDPDNLRVMRVEEAN